MLAEVAWPPAERPLVFVCGPTAFVETAANALVDARPRAGPDQDRTIRTDGRLEMESQARRQRDRGLLLEVFGAEMTTAEGICVERAGARAAVAGCEVYLDAPGTVVRCRGARRC